MAINITFLMLFLVIFKGNKNGIFPWVNIPFNPGNNFFPTFYAPWHIEIGTKDVMLQYKLHRFQMSEKQKGPI